MQSGRLVGKVDVAIGAMQVVAAAKRSELRDRRIGTIRPART
jgi:hypothetical protein